jgi:hypothetical protein
MKGSSKLSEASDSMTRQALKVLFSREELEMLYQALQTYTVPEHEWEDDDEECAEADANYEKLENIRERLTELFE